MVGLDAHLAPLSAMQSELRILDDYFRLRDRCALPFRPEKRRHPPRHVDVDAAQLSAWIDSHRRRPAVHLLANTNVERQLGQELDTVLLGHAFTAARAEKVLLVAAVRANVRTHI